MGDLSEHFSRAEMRCKCGCSFADVSPALVTMLETARRNAGVPFVITSGCRCAIANISAGGTSHSAHLFGGAADIRTKNDRTRYLVLLGLITAGCRRVEIAKDHIHADIACGPLYPQDIAMLP